MSLSKFDRIARDLGMPPDWREQGYDSPDTMLRVYPEVHGGPMRCPFPRCKFVRHSVEAMFRHVHDPKKHRAQHKAVRANRARLGLADHEEGNS